MTERVATFTSWFLDAPSHLYMRVCPSVRPSVGPQVRLSRVIFRRVLGASCAVYPALFFFIVPLSTNFTRIIPRLASFVVVGITGTLSNDNVCQSNGQNDGTVEHSRLERPHYDITTGMHGAELMIMFPFLILLSPQLWLSSRPRGNDAFVFPSKSVQLHNYLVKHGHA